MLVNLLVVSFFQASIFGNHVCCPVTLVMNPSLIKDIISRSHTLQVFLWNPNLEEPVCREINLLSQQRCLENFTSCCELFAKAFEFTDETFSFPWSKTTHKLKHTMHVLMINQQV